MNEFSLVCRLLGSLFNRSPDDEVLAPVITLIAQGKLKAHWPLEQDALLDRLQANCDLAIIVADYQHLFAQDGAVLMHFSDYREKTDSQNPESEVRAFLTVRGMKLADEPCDSFGSLLLAASWLEDQSAEDEIQAQQDFFDQFLLSWSDSFLGKVEAHAHSAFYRTLVTLTREALFTLRVELLDEEESLEENSTEENN